MQRRVYLIVADMIVKVYFWNADFMRIWTLAGIRITLIAPLACTVSDVVHEVLACQSLTVPAGGENNFDLQVGTLACRETRSFIALTCVDRPAVVCSSLAVFLTSAVIRNARLGPIALPRNHRKTRWKCNCSRCLRSRGAPNIVG